MNDMASVITPKSDQLNADSLLAGPLTITITLVEIRPGTEQPVSVFYDGDAGNPWKPCKSMMRVMVAVWGADSKQYIGRSLTLYRDASVKWGGVEVGGIRISHMTHMNNAVTMALTATKGSRKPYTVHPLAGTTAPIDAARSALVNAKSLADLETAWRSKSMAPFREALGDVLAEAKAGLADREPDQAAAAPDSKPLWMQLVEGAVMAADRDTVDKLQATFDANEGDIPIDRLAEIQDALDAAVGRIG